jgi:ABC-type transport system substrate-binding protein
MRSRKVLVLVVCWLLIMVAGCNNKPPTEEPGNLDPVYGGTLRFALGRDSVAFDPHIYYGASSASIQGNIYDGLIGYAPDGTLRPELAKSWENPDDNTWIFHLHSGVKFHDGSDFNAEDVIYSLERIMDPETAATRGGLLRAQIVSMEALDELTVKITLAGPNATFLSVLAAADCYMVDKEWGESGHNFKSEANGTGPFMLAEYEPGVQYVLVRNPNYWKEGLPYLDKLVLVPIQDDNTRINSLKNGDIDMAEVVPWQDTISLKKPPYKIYSGYETFNFVRINTSRAPLDNPKVRQALNYIIDREEICQVAFGGEAKPISAGLILEDHWAFSDELKGYWKKDHELAKKLLAEAGYSDPSQLKLTLESSNLPIHLDNAQLIQNQLSNFGIDVTLKVLEVPTLLEKRTSGDYGLLMDGTSLPWPDPDAYAQFFHSTEGTIFAKAVGFCNEELDRLLELGRTVLNQEERKDIYYQAEQVLLEEAPWIFVLWRSQAESTWDYVQGFVHFGGAAGFYSTANLENVWLNKVADE